MSDRSNNDDLVIALTKFTEDDALKSCDALTRYYSLFHKLIIALIGGDGDMCFLLSLLKQYARTVEIVEAIGANNKWLALAEKHHSPLLTQARMDVDEKIQAARVLILGLARTIRG